MGRWIPCSERVPEASGDYLTVYQGSGCRFQDVRRYFVNIKTGR